jgi:hypothetical protein
MMAVDSAAEPSHSGSVACNPISRSSSWVGLRRKQNSDFFFGAFDSLSFHRAFGWKREKDIIIIFWQSSSVKVLETWKSGGSKAQACPFGKAP